MPKAEKPYPPDLCSIDTLAHRLDCSASTIRSYVARGLLPKPIVIGDLVRWRWADVSARLDRLALGHLPEDDDPYMSALSGPHDATPETTEH